MSDSIKNRIPVEDPEQVLVTNGGIHGVYMLCQALLERSSCRYDNTCHILSVKTSSRTWLSGHHC
jgi:hypothetical protein